MNRISMPNKRSTHGESFQQKPRGLPGLPHSKSMVANRTSRAPPMSNTSTGVSSSGHIDKWKSKQNQQHNINSTKLNKLFLSIEDVKTMTSCLLMLQKQRMFIKQSTLKANSPDISNMGLWAWMAIWLHIGAFRFPTSCGPKKRRAPNLLPDFFFKTWPYTSNPLTPPHTTI